MGSIFDLSHIDTPAAGDRMPLDSASNVGGHSRRDEFVYRRADGIFVADIAAADPSLGAASPGLEMRTSLTTMLAMGGGTAGMGYALWLQGKQDNGGYTGNHFPLALNPMGGNVGIGLGNNAAPVVRLHAKSSAEIMRLETTTPRGGGANYMAFHDPSGRQGYIGYGGAGNDIVLMNELAGVIRFGSAGIFRWNIDDSRLAPAADNGYAIGGPANRPNVVYAVTGTINTSDEREKTWRVLSVDDRSMHMPHFTEAELRVGLRAIEELGFFQWNDAIALKGPEEARPHVGPRAQRLWAICAEEGLCPALVQREPGGDWLPPEGSIPPAFLCFDEWGEETAPVMAWWKPSATLVGIDEQPIMVPCEEGEEGTEQRPTGETYVSRPAGNRFGVRIDQLHSLMIAALNAERLSQEAVAVEQAATIADLLARVVALEPAA